MVGGTGPVNVGGISVPIGADTSGFEAGIARARSGLQSFGSVINNVLRRLQNFTIGLGLSAGAISLMLRRTAQFVDQLAKSADALGTTTQHLQALEHQAGLTGVKVDAVERAIFRLQRGLGEAIRGTGLAKDALDLLGLSAQELADMDTAEAMSEIAQRLNQVENQALRTSLANDIFGRGATEIRNLLEVLGREGLEPTVQLLEQMGVALSRVDAAKVEMANDAFFVLSQTLRSFWQQLVVQLAPILQAIVESVQKWIIEMGGLGNIAKSVFNFMLDAAGFVADTIHVLRGGFAGLNLAVSALGVIGFGTFRILIRAFGLLADQVNGFINGVLEAADAMSQMAGMGSISFRIPSFSETEFSQSIESMNQSMIDRFNDARNTVEEIISSPFPSTAIDQWANEVAERAERLAEEIANRTSSSLGELDDDIVSRLGGDGDEDKEAERAAARFEAEQERRRAELQALQDSLLSAEDLEREHYARRLEMVSEFAMAGLLTLQERATLERELQEQHLENMEQLEERAAQERQRIQDAELKNRLSSLATFGDVTLGILGGIFQDSKIIAIAQALLAARESIVHAYNWGSRIGGPAFGAVAAAAAAAATAIQVAAVRNTTVGGGGGGSASGGGSTVPTPTTTTGSGASQAPRTAIINLTGGPSFSQNDIRRIVEQINELGGDGFDVRVSGGVRV